MPAAYAPVHYEQAARAAANRTERAIVRIVNRYRTRYGLRALRLSPRLTYAAGLHSLDQARRGVISHAGSDGSTVSRRVLAVTNARVIGETLVAAPRGRRLTAPTVVRMWMSSPPHRAELLSPRFRRVGVARALGPRGTFITADFASAR